MVRPLADKDPELALAVIDAIPGAGKRDEAFAEYLRSRRPHDPMEFVSWAESLEQPRRRFLALNEWVRRQAGYRSDQVARYIANSARPSERDALIKTWSRTIRLPETPEEQLRQLETMMADLNDEQRRPLLDAILKSQADKLAPEIKTGIEAGRSIEALIQTGN